MAADNPREVLVLDRIPDIELDRRFGSTASGIRQDGVDVVQERHHLPALNRQMFLIDHVRVRPIGLYSSPASISVRPRFDPEGFHAQGECDSAAEIEIDREIDVQVGVLRHDS